MHPGAIGPVVTGELIQLAFKTHEVTFPETYEILVELAPYHVVGYDVYFFAVVKSVRPKSPLEALGGLLLQDVAMKVVDFAKGEFGVDLADTIGDAIDSQRGSAIDTKKIYEKAAKLGGEMQLWEAQRIGPGTYQEAKHWGLVAKRLAGGLVRFKPIVYHSMDGLEVIVRGAGPKDCMQLFDWFGLQGRMMAKVGDLQAFQAQLYNIDYAYVPEFGMFALDD